MPDAAAQRLPEPAICGPRVGDLLAASVTPHPTDEGFAGENPVGWQRNAGFNELFPWVTRPTQIAERVSFGRPDLPPNRLIRADNLHIMRQLPAETVNLIYIDPPFFTGRRHAIAGDSNDDGFDDTWLGGINGYLAWLNARLFEMKRLLTATGSILVHCDWHASHYIKTEMDKLFGCDRFQNEIIWSYRSGGGSKRRYGRKHDTLLWYTQARDGHTFHADAVRVPYDAAIAESRRGFFHPDGKVCGSVWDISRPPNHSKEWLGYPTQKPEALIERIIRAHSSDGDLVADFFCGSGTTTAVAQRLGRRWIACDESRAAVEITTQRLANASQLRTGAHRDVADFTVEHWGEYRIERGLEEQPQRLAEFILRAFGAVPGRVQTGIHGVKGEHPCWVTDPARRTRVTAREVTAFGSAIEKASCQGRDACSRGFMLARAFESKAEETAERLRQSGQVDISFVHFEIAPIASERPIANGAVRSTAADWSDRYLTFGNPSK